MNIVMAGIDYKTASIDLREKVSFTSGEVRTLLARIREKSNVSGVVIISTCNRTEIYISYNEYDEEIDPVEVFFEAANLNDKDFKSIFYTKREEEACIYLFELASGIHSMIFGEDQIISQVKDAIHIAREEGASDATLNTLVRCAVTCAKKVKTQLVLRSVCPSVAKQSVEILNEYLSANVQRKALIIGSGVIGKMVCEELLIKDCEVFMTLRNHCNKKTILPTGCKTIEYDKRQQLISDVDILISATSSPHQTITYAMVANCKTKPLYIIDLAVPRDIDPEIKNIPGIRYYNVDTLGENARRDNSKEIATIRLLIVEHIEKFRKWKRFNKMSLEVLVSTRNKM